MFFFLFHSSERRNKQGDSRLYVSSSSPHFKILQSLYNKDKAENSRISVVMDGMRGIVSRANDNVPLHG